MCKTGSITIDGVLFLYSAKVYDEGSKYGINGGRISKLSVVKDIHNEGWEWENCIINYDHEWDVRPEADLDKKVLDYFLELYK